MAEARQGPSGPHELQSYLDPLEHAERELHETAENPGIGSAPGTAPALADEPVE